MMRYQHQRIRTIIYDDPVRNMQLLGAVVAWMRAMFVLVFDPATWNPRVALVQFHYFPDWLWAIALLIVGTLQWWAAGTRRWRWKFWMANIQSGMLTYGLVIVLLTHQQGGQAVPLITGFIIMHVHIAARALRDKVLNGTDRRLYSDHAY